MYDVFCIITENINFKVNIDQHLFFGLLRLTLLLSPISFQSHNPNHKFYGLFRLTHILLSKSHVNQIRVIQVD